VSVDLGISAAQKYAHRARHTPQLEAARSINCPEIFISFYSSVQTTSVFAGIFYPGFFPIPRARREKCEVVKQFARFASKVLSHVKVEDGGRFANIIECCGKIIRCQFLSRSGNEHHPEDTYDLEWYEAIDVAPGPFEIGFCVPACPERWSNSNASLGTVALLC